MPAVAAADLKTGLIPQVIDGVLPQVGVTMMWGPSQARKSSIAWWMAHCISSGAPWAGHKTKKGTLLYFVSEGMTGAGNRNYAGIMNSRKRVPAKECRSAACYGANCKCTDEWFYDDSNIIVNDTKFSMRDPKSVGAVIRSTQQIPFLRAIVIDVIGGFKGRGVSLEFPTPATDVMEQAQRLAAEAKTQVFLVHHATKKGDAFRGAQVLFDLADTFIQVKPPGDDGSPGEIICEKQKDGPFFDPVMFESKVVYWKSRAEDEKATSAVVVQELADPFLDEMPARKRTVPPRAITPEAAGVKEIRRGNMRAVPGLRAG